MKIPTGEKPLGLFAGMACRFDWCATRDIIGLGQCDSDRIPHRVPQIVQTM